MVWVSHVSLGCPVSTFRVGMFSREGFQVRDRVFVGAGKLCPYLARNCQSVGGQFVRLHPARVTSVDALRHLIGGRT